MTDSLRDEVDALNIDARDLIVNLFVEFVFAVRILRVDEQAGNVNAGVVDENINLVKGFKSRLNHSLDTSRLRYVGDDVFNLAAVLSDVEFGLIGVEVAYYDICAVVEESLSDSLADTRRRASHDSRFAFQAEPRAVSDFLIFRLKDFNHVTRLDFGHGFVFHMNGAFEEFAFAAVKLNRNVSEVHQVLLDFGADLDNLKLSARNFINVAGLNHASQLIAGVHNASIAQFGKSHCLIKHDDHIRRRDEVFHLPAELNDFA